MELKDVRLLSEYIDKHHGKVRVLFQHPDDGATLIAEIIEDTDKYGCVVRTEACFLDKR